MPASNTLSQRRKRLRLRKAKPGELLIGYGRLDGDNPDIVYSRGEGVHRGDGHLLHYYLGSPKLENDWSQPTGGGRLSQTKYAPTLWQELESRGYDLTTLRFYIKKKEPSPVS